MPARPCHVGTGTGPTPVHVCTRTGPLRRVGATGRSGGLCSKTQSSSTSTRRRPSAHPPLPTSAPGLGPPLPTSAPGLGSPLPTSAPGLGLLLPHLHQNWARPLPHLHQDWACLLPHLHRDWALHAVRYTVAHMGSHAPQRWHSRQRTLEVLRSYLHAPRPQVAPGKELGAFDMRTTKACPYLPALPSCLAPIRWNTT